MGEVICTVDVVLLTIEQEQLMVALSEREHVPFAGRLALPGGYVHAQDASVFDAAMRVMRAKTGFTPPYLEQLATFSGPQRDPRGWSLSVAHYALVPFEMIGPAAAGRLSLVPVAALPELPFDHGQIVSEAVARLRSKSHYSSLPCFLAGDVFTLPQLQRMYELLMGEALNKVSFRRKMGEMDMLEAVEGAFGAAGAHRPAQLYRLKEAYRARVMTLERGL
ncbi:NUDIX hydrolase [Massilia sp. PAMC28688]|uniref:NUDIX hydrolase n=1 Tax=Massilia sp. PAMC28688 TaxID=2861283 RepID=UPI001C6271BB|nr:NUDIX domain-containing protein [Massilia sp. PAMC28688]QYF92731.1 NUDIX hydrolase [Massilia sp. PAMC28688]